MTGPSPDRVRAVVMDLDGTVVDEHGQVTVASRRSAAELAERGIPLIVATARTPAWVMATLPLASSVTVAVCCGGSIGVAPDSGQVLWRDAIPAAAVAAVVRLAARTGSGLGLAAYDGIRWRMTEEFRTGGPARPGSVELVSTSGIADGVACALSICRPDGGPADLAGLVAAEVGGALRVGSASPDLVDAGPAGVDKATGLRRALAVVGVDPSRALVFADMPADLPMFALCGYSVAVANAHLDVIAGATLLAECVHADGFARTLARLGLVTAYDEEDRPAGPGCGCPPVRTAAAEGRGERGSSPPRRA